MVDLSYKQRKLCYYIILGVTGNAITNRLEVYNIYINKLVKNQKDEKKKQMYTIISE